jgi:allantoate deiminase
MSAAGLHAHAERVVARCRELGTISDVAGGTTRLFLSDATRTVQTLLRGWMEEAGLATRVDDAGNVRGARADGEARARVALVSHIDTVPNAGAFDGVLGVVLGLEAIELVRGEPLPFDLELIAFSEEEGVRFRFPFFGSMAVTGQVTREMLERRDAQGVPVAEALRGFGLQPETIASSCALDSGTFAALEVHIEQGPVLDRADERLGVVETIAGQSRYALTFTGQANHAGTTPMALRQDALAAAAAWVVDVERYVAAREPMVATVGQLEVSPGTVNVVPGSVRATLDLRHPNDEERRAAVAELLVSAEECAKKRGVRVSAERTSEQAAVPMDAELTAVLREASREAGAPARAMLSGAGHDAMILAPRVQTAMLFVRSPSGLSHHPDETVRVEDVEAALATVIEFLRRVRPRSR